MLLLLMLEVIGPPVVMNDVVPSLSRPGGWRGFVAGAGRGPEGVLADTHEEGAGLHHLHGRSVGGGGRTNHTCSHPPPTTGRQAGRPANVVMAAVVDADAASSSLRRPRAPTWSRRWCARWTCCRTPGRPPARRASSGPGTTHRLPGTREGEEEG